MENVYDWKTFIEPHLFSSKSLEFIGISEPYHFRFYQQNNHPHVQHKIYANDAWRRVDGEVYLNTIPDRRSKPGFADTSRKTIFYDNFVSFWTRHSKHSCQLGRVIPSIHVTLDISCHFGQCHKRPCFLLM